MIIDRLRAFLGKPHLFNADIPVYSPTLSEIADIGEIEYSIHMTLCSFNTRTILVNLFGLSETDIIRLMDEDPYDLLTSHPSIPKYISKAYSFFVKDNVSYHPVAKTFNIGDKVLVNSDNYMEMYNVIKELNGLKDSKESPAKFKNNKAKELFEKMNAVKTKNAKNTGLDIKDILSIICCAEGNGIHVFNASNLTVYQMYEHFERINLKENHNRLLPVWANGYLKENSQLPEWLVRTKF
ncbi:hypothetical protein P4H67_09045 [Paenibacillus lautus]|uniref:hypothetical protein n=1 Tax=Paenibacillus lautus TaxID=1401 RepID=UPI002DBE597A|nr:hypothetical protein [Paenibacillus lautus]MEC0306902.1 hypothetical protein [Paenibacillus lautus]